MIASIVMAALIQTQALPQGPVLPPCAPETIEVCREPVAIAAEKANARLGSSEQVFWIDGDVLHVLARRSKPPQLCCAVASAMEPVTGARDVWTVSARIPDIDRAMLDVWVLPATGGRPEEWRGPDAPRAPAILAPRDGEVVRRVVQSTSLNEARGLFIYRPPGEGPMPVIYLADGESTESFASLLRPMIEAGEIPPMMIVGLWSGPLLQEGQSPPPNRRHEEYLAGWNHETYAAHERFLVDEVMPLAESLGASSAPRDRVLAGFSDGAAWALNTALVHPDLFRNAIVMSLGSALDSRAKGEGYGAIYLTAGTLEPGFHDATVAAASTLEGASEAVRLDVGIAGHSQMLWQERFPHALRWLFSSDATAAADKRQARGGARAPL